MRKRTNILTAIAACFISAIGYQSYGQYFVPPLAYNFDYNTPALPNTGNVCHTANYSIADIPTGFGNADVYLAGWSAHGGTNSEITYQFTAPGNPSAILYQDTLSIPNADEVSVGCVRVNSQDFILVSYLSLGATPGYRVNLYQINISTVTPVSPAGSVTLSTDVGGEGRISMDCHRQYGVAVAYATSAGIETRVAYTSGGLTLSAGVTLAGTAGNRSPDVAFSHSNSGLNLHYVYYNPSTYRLTESVLNYNTVLSMSSPGSLTPAIQDINQLPISMYNFYRYIRPVIDCPDHYDVENWAYTYTYSLTSAPNANGSMSSDGIFVRYVDYHSTGVPATVNVADGSLGNASCLNYFPIFPTLCYGEEGFGYNTGQIHVAWFNQENPTQDGGMFVAVHMSEDGSGFLSMPDYLVIPNSSNSFAATTSIAVNLYDYYISPIALSKNSDAMFNIAPNFLYTTYLYGNPMSLRFNHVFHEWGNNNAYKGAPPSPAGLFPECGKMQDLVQQEHNMQVQPNPFTDVASASFSLQESGRLQLQLYDFLGRVVWQQEKTATMGTRTEQLDNLQKLPAGTYVLKSFLNGEQIGTQKIIKQQ